MKKHYASGYQTNPNLPQFITGRVIDCNPAAYTVDVSSEGRTLLACPIMGLYSTDFGQDLVWLHNYRGAQVLMINTGEQYVVMGTLPSRKMVDPLSDLPPASAGVPGFGGDDAKTYAKGVFKDFSQHRPVDFMPGDKILRNDDGAELGLFRGGWAWLKASSLAQVIVGKVQSIVRIISRRFDLYTDFGTIEFYNRGAMHKTEFIGNRTGVHLSGGADWEKETHPSKNRHTVQVWMGDCPGPSHREDDPRTTDEREIDRQKERFRIRVGHIGDAEAEAAVGMDYDGNMDTFLAGSNSVEVMHNHREKVHGDHSVEVLENCAQIVKGDKVVEVEGEFDETIFGECTEVVHEDKSVTLMGDLDDTILGSANMLIQGDSVTIVGKDKTVTVTGPVTISSAVVINLVAPAVNIGGVLSVSSGVGGAGGVAQFTKPVHFTQTVKVTGHATFEGGVTGDNYCTHE